MVSRVHPNFPTRDEVNANPDIAYSDHLPILAQVPLGEKNASLNIISLNILGGTNCSGIHTLQHEENEEALIKRYERIAEGLAKGSQQHDVDMILLQEAPIQIVDALKHHFNEHWELIVDSAGLVTCYNKQRLTQQATSYDRNARVRSLTFQDKRNDNLTIDVHNIWGNYSPLPYHMEEECRTKLTKTDSQVSVILGDTNSRIAALDNIKRNLATGVIPAMFHLGTGLPYDLQIPDHPDGGFYRDQNGAIHQLSTQVLDFATGTLVVDDRSPEEIGAWTESRMIMCLDDSYKQKIVADEKNIFDYEATLQLLLKETSLHVRITSDIFNNKGIAMAFPNSSTALKLLKKQISTVNDFKFVTFDDKGFVFQCIFAPIEKIDLLNQAIHSLSKTYLQKKTEGFKTQINKFFNSWTPATEKNNAQPLIGTHPNILFSEKNSSVKSIKQELNSQVDGPANGILKN